MRKRRYAVSLALFLCVPFLASSLNVSVLIYSTSPVKSMIIATASGKYTIVADGKTIDTCTTQSVYEISLIKDSVMLKTLGKTIGVFGSIRFHRFGENNKLSLRPVSENKTRLYDDDLVASSNITELKLINICELEHYIAGVVQCEAGYRRPIEYYKVQAIICRTYAMSNLAKHIADGCELCDGVHCQVYHGTCTVVNIAKAVETTKGLVLVDGNDKLIVAAFHANCGGYTLNSEDVWNAPLPYLRAVRDTFCLHQPAATWVKHMSLKTWDDYLRKKEKGLQKDTLRTEAYWDSIPENRKIYIYDHGYTIPLKEIRLDLNLHSTCFAVVKDGNNITLNGRGYGHRVGLCQEGAIHMAELGYNYQQILHYYYTDVQLIDYSILPSSGFN